jgi:6-pyruvoyltetrahydropterin/6-carboxytetrahydropterin synthase
MTSPAHRPGGAFEIGKQFTFEAGHRLVGFGRDHKCARQHGHSYRVEVILTRNELVEPGIVTDFGDLAPFGAYLKNELDHRNLHEVLPFEPTTPEPHAVSRDRPASDPPAGHPR